MDSPLSRQGTLYGGDQVALLLRSDEALDYLSVCIQDDEGGVEVGLIPAGKLTVLPGIIVEAYERHPRAVLLFEPVHDGPHQRAERSPLGIHKHKRRPPRGNTGGRLGSDGRGGGRSLHS